MATSSDFGAAFRTFGLHRRTTAIANGVHMTIWALVPVAFVEVHGLDDLEPLFVCDAQSFVDLFPDFLDEGLVFLANGHTFGAFPSAGFDAGLAKLAALERALAVRTSVLAFLGAWWAR